VPLTQLMTIISHGSMDYPFTVIEIRLNAKGEGEAPAPR
jgi:hypothetical protein